MNEEINDVSKEMAEAHKLAVIDPNVFEPGVPVAEGAVVGYIQTDEASEKVAPALGEF